VQLLLEIGTEELPASAVYLALDQLERHLMSLLDKSMLPADSIRLLATPRRLALIADGLPPRAQSEVSKKRGPALEKARDGEEWTRAAEGFAKAQGISADELVIEDTGKGSYVFAVKETEGAQAKEILTGLLAELVGSLRFPKSMRWGSSEMRFARPVRWLLAILDGEVVPFTYGDLTASNVTYGHRYLSKGPIEIATASDYEGALEKAFVIADHNRRREEIESRAAAECEKTGDSPLLDIDVLTEVVQLVEWPGVVLGSFDERYLRVPREVLVHAMQSHQRYFPVEAADGNLKHSFIAIHNGDPDHSDVIVKGHERVLAARLADAEFFLDEDMKRTLEERTADLENVVYQSELGSMADKSKRLSVLVEQIGEGIEFGAETVQRAKRAASLAKSDLVTHMVVEFPDLQGTVGAIYAAMEGEDKLVAAGIGEQYMPRRTGDILPLTEEGALVSLAEKSDNLAASFGLGHVPTGSEDPYALRRQALGMLQIIVERELPLSVSEMVGAAADELESGKHGFKWSDEAEEAFEEFFTTRERFYLEARYRYDLVESALMLDWDRPLALTLRLEALEKARESGLLERLSTTYERCRNLSKEVEEGEVDESLLVEDAEKAVYDVFCEAGPRAEEAVKRLEFVDALKELEAVCAPVDTLFEDVLIMAEDAEIKANRLALLAGIADLFDEAAYFPSLAWD